MACLIRRNRVNLLSSASFIAARNLTSESRFFRARTKAGSVRSMLCSRSRSPNRDSLPLPDLDLGSLLSSGAWDGHE